MGKNTRYIKTKIDGDPKILHLLTCNLCPLLIFDKGPNATRCAKFHSISTNMTDSNIYSYSVMGNNAVPIKDIDIPDWCGLSEEIAKAHSSGDMYVKSGNNSYEIIPDIYQNLVIMSSMYVGYDQKLDNLVSGTNKTINFRYNRNASLPAKIETPTTSTPTYRTCSCCGELKEGVNRDKDFGMCPTCWEKYKDDKKMKEFCFINNFRLKRSAKWSDEVYKEIKEIE